MTLLDRYLLRRLAATYLRVLAALVAMVVLVDFLTARASDIIRFQVPWSALLDYYAAFAWTVVYTYQAGAVSLLVAGLLVLGRAAQDNELTAALAAGVSLRRIVAVPLLAGVALSIALGVFSDTAGVRLFQRFYKVEEEYFRRYDKPLMSYSWPRLADGWSVHVTHFNRRAMTGEDVLMHKMTPETFTEIRAHRIYWEPEQSRWLLEDGRWSEFEKQAEWAQKTRRITQAPAPIVETPEVLFSLDMRPELLSSSTLGTELRRAEALGLRVERHWVSYWAKFAVPALPAIMLLLAVPFAARLRRGGYAISFGVSIALGLGYIFVHFIGMGLGQLGDLPPLPAAWLANGLFLALGLLLLYRTPT